jgi:phage tail tape-measure protein
MDGRNMSRKKLIMLGMVVGSIAGGYLPALVGVDGLMFSLLGSFIGGIIGIWIGYKVSG